jgi:hypothetical protein
LKEIPISWALIMPCEKRLSVTVGILVFVAGLLVSAYIRREITTEFEWADTN